MLLAGLGTDAAATALFESLLSGEPVAGPQFPVDVHGFLLRSSQRERAQEFLRQRRPSTMAETFALGFSPFARHLPELAGGEARGSPMEETLWSLATGPDPGIHISGLATRAVEGLAKYDRGDALEIARVQLARSRKDRELWIRLIVDRAAAEIAGWQSDTSLLADLGQFTCDSEDAHLQSAARRACARIRRLESARALAPEIASATGRRQWILADAWYRLTGPLLVRKHFSPAPISAVFRTLPAAFHRALSETYKQHLEAMRREAADVDGELTGRG
jgi:hypothetical protein